MQCSIFIIQFLFSLTLYTHTHFILHGVLQQYRSLSNIVNAQVIVEIAPFTKPHAQITPVSCQNECANDVSGLFYT